MQNDEPTPPQHIGYTSEAATDPVAFGEAPTWPPARERSPRRRVPDGSPLFWLSLGATGTVLIGLVGLLLLNQLGMFVSRGTPGSSVPHGASGNATTAPLPTATASATVSSLALSGWLQVTPSSVRLRCDGDQQTQLVVLANTGPQTVQWQAVVEVSADQARIAIAPSHGDLAAGATVSVQLENTTQTSSQGGSDSEGVIRFVSTAATAGSPSVLSYRLDNCS
jgi:hypothetical protein